MTHSEKWSFLKKSIIRLLSPSLVTVIIHCHKEFDSKMPRLQRWQSLEMLKLTIAESKHFPTGCLYLKRHQPQTIKADLYASLYPVDILPYAINI